MWLAKVRAITQHCTIFGLKLPSEKFDRQLFRPSIIICMLLHAAKLPGLINNVHLSPHAVKRSADEQSSYYSHCNADSSTGK